MLGFRKLLIAKKFMDKKGGGFINTFLRKFFVSHTKIFVGEPFRMSLISGIEKF